MLNLEICLYKATCLFQGSWTVPGIIGWRRYTSLAVQGFKSSTSDPSAALILVCFRRFLLSRKHVSPFTHTAGREQRRQSASCCPLRHDSTTWFSILILSIATTDGKKVKVHPKSTLFSDRHDQCSLSLVTKPRVCARRHTAVTSVPRRAPARV